MGKVRKAFYEIFNTYQWNMTKHMHKILKVQHFVLFVFLVNSNVAYIMGWKCFDTREWVGSISFYEKYFPFFRSFHKITKFSASLCNQVDFLLRDEADAT